MVTLKDFIRNSLNYLAKQNQRIALINSTWFSESHNAFSGNVPTDNGRHSNLLPEKEGSDYSRAFL